MNQHDKTFVTILAAIMGGLVVVAVMVFVIARMVTSTTQQNMISRVGLEAAVAERIAPVGRVVVAGDETESMPAVTPGASEAPAETDQSTAGGESIDGEALYPQACAACHDTGAANAPKTGDKAAWADRIAQGKETLIQHAVNGFNAMPPKGGAMQLSDAEVGAIVEYMVGASQ